MRQEGYYWVKFNGSTWQIAEWFKYYDKFFWCFGGIGTYNDRDMDQINENRIPEPE